MYLMNIPQEEENELDALQSAKELEEEKKKEKERQAKMESIVLLNLFLGFLGIYKNLKRLWIILGWYCSGHLHDCDYFRNMCCCIYKGNTLKSLNLLCTYVEAILLRQILQHCLWSFGCPTKQCWPFIVWTLYGCIQKIQNNSPQSQ